MPTVVRKKKEREVRFDGSKQFVCDIINEPKVLRYTVELLKEKVKKPSKPFEFITITLKPKMYKYTAEQQFRYTYRYVDACADMLEDYCCVTELTKDGNVHYHIWTIGDHGVFINRLKKYTECIGFITVTKLKHNKELREQIEDTYEYMIKSIERTYSCVRNTKMVFNKIEDQLVQDPSTEINCLDHMVHAPVKWTTKIKTIQELNEIIIEIKSLE